MDELEDISRRLAEDPNNEQELLQLARIYHAARTYERIQARDPLPAYERTMQKIKRKRQKLWIGRAAQWAACIAGVIILSSVFSHLQDRHTLEAPTQTVTLQANAGMRTHFDLPDGTLVHLNAGSRLTYPIPYSKTERRVSLSGEAFFEVTEDKHHPFIVSVNQDELQIKVLGTSFNVEAYEEDHIVNATLVKGKINILLNNQGVRREYTLLPSQKVTYDVREKTMQIKMSNNLRETAWMKGILSFKETPLPEVLRKLSHYYDVNFEVKDPIIDTYLFTGTFDNSQLQHVLHYLEISSGISYTLIQTDKDDSEGVHRRKVILRKKTNKR
jgi:ferric-dicitrate binding protein FerR (iron transport regulator)